MKQNYSRGLWALALSLVVSNDFAADNANVDPKNVLQKWGHSQHGAAWDQGPRAKPWRMEGIGQTSFPITSSNSEVQEWFNQGHTLLHSFWPFEAERAFRWCLKLDPNCAMAYWGLARCAERDDSSDRSKAFLKEASKRKANVSKRERDYIEVWEAKIATPENGENSDKARQRHRVLLEKLLMEYPDDLEAKALYWIEAGGQRYGNEAVLQEVLRRQPDHVGALHYRIHNWDGKEGRFAVDSCLRLSKAAPQSGHLQHMPGHVLSGIGLWHEAAIAMDAATRVEKDYMRRRMILPEDNWNYLHNLDYLAYIQEQLGLYEAASLSARQSLLATRIREPARFADYHKVPLVRLLLKYEKWDQVLSLTNLLEWNTNSASDRSLRAYGETRAHLGLGHLDEASERIANFKRLAEGQPAGSNNSNSPVRNSNKRLEVMELELRGLLGLARTNSLEGIESLSRAARLQEEIWQNDPPDHPAFLYNVLGEAYLKLQSPRLAADAFRKTLETVFNDGFALSGLARAQAQLGDIAGARESLSRLKSVWQDADRTNRWWTAAMALGIEAPVAQDDSIRQRRYKLEILDKLGPSRWESPVAPELTAKGLDGSDAALSQFAGKNVLLIVYQGGECLHCMEQIQLANKRLESFQALDTQIAAISKDSLESIRRYKDSGKLGVTLLSDPSFATARRYQSYDDFEEIELHSTVLIDKQGHVHWSKHGGQPFTDFDFLEAELKQLARSEVRVGSN